MFFFTIEKEAPEIKTADIASFSVKDARESKEVVKDFGRKESGWFVSASVSFTDFQSTFDLTIM